MVGRRVIPPLLITGMPRSGTSATARFLALSGLEIGEKLNPPRKDNRLGYYEDASFYELDRRLIAAALPVPERGRPRWMQVDYLDFECLAPWIPEARELVAMRASGGKAWGFKDPRITQLLPFWNEAAPDAGYVFVYRAPWDVLDSLSRLEGRPLEQQVAASVDAWCTHNRKLLEFLEEHRSRCVALHVAALGTARVAVIEQVNRVLKHIGSPPLPRAAGEAFVPSMLSALPPGDLRRALVEEAFPEMMRLYERLEGAADVGSNAVRVASFRSSRRAGTGAVPLQLVAVGATVETDTAITTTEVDGEPHPAFGANIGVADFSDSDIVAVVFDAGVVPEALEQARLALTADVAAVVLGASPDVRQITVHPLHLWSFLSGRVDVRGIVMHRRRWAACGGFDERLPGVGLEAWALAVSILDQGHVVLHLQGAFPGASRTGTDDEIRAIAIRHVAARHPAIFADAVIPDDAGTDRFELIESLETQVQRLERDVFALEGDRRTMQAEIERIDRERRDQAAAAVGRLMLSERLAARLDETERELAVQRSAASERLALIGELTESLRRFGRIRRLFGRRDGATRGPSRAPETDVRSGLSTAAVNLMGLAKESRAIDAPRSSS